MTMVAVLAVSLLLPHAVHAGRDTEALNKVVAKEHSAYLTPSGRVGHTKRGSQEEKPAATQPEDTHNGYYFEDTDMHASKIKNVVGRVTQEANDAGTKAQKVSKDLTTYMNKLNDLFKQLAVMTEKQNEYVRKIGADALAEEESRNKAFTDLDKELEKKHFGNPATDQGDDAKKSSKPSSLLEIDEVVITVPAGVAPGANVNFPGAHGEQLTAVVPEGKKPGDTFTVAGGNAPQAAMLAETIKETSKESGLDDREDASNTKVTAGEVGKEGDGEDSSDEADDVQDASATAVRAEGLSGGEEAVRASGSSTPGKEEEAAPDGGADQEEAAPAENGDDVEEEAAPAENGDDVEEEEEEAAPAENGDDVEEEAAPAEGADQELAE